MIIVLTPHKFPTVSYVSREIVSFSDFTKLFKNSKGTHSIDSADFLIVEGVSVVASTL